MHFDWMVPRDCPEIRRRRNRTRPRVERSAYGAKRNPGVLNTSAVRSERAADVSFFFFARALGWESDRLDTRSLVYKRLPLFQSGPPIRISTQGSASLTASLHPGLRSLTPSAYLLKMPQLQSFFYAKRSLPEKVEQMSRVF